MNNSESFLLLLKNLLKCTYEVLLPSQRNTEKEVTDVCALANPPKIGNPVEQCGCAGS